MIGPLFTLELLRGSRRGRLQTLRQVYAGWLILQFIILFLGLLSAATFRFEPPFFSTAQVNMRVLSRFTNSYIELFVLQHFVLVLLVTPAFVAGSIAEDKARGTLQHLLIADVSSSEIIAGKALGRMAQVALLALAGLPLISFIGGFGHLDRLTLAALAVVGVGPLFALGSASVLASVWSQRARDAVLRVYWWLSVGVIVIWAFDRYATASVAALVQYGLPLSPAERWLWQLDAALVCLNPLHVLAPAWEQNQAAELTRRTAVAALMWGGCGVFCLALAVWRLRPACLRQMEGAGGRRHASFRTRRPAVTDDAMRWKEREIEGLAVFPWLRRVPRWLGIATVAAVTVYFFHREWYLGQALLVLFVASIVVGIRSSGAVCGERERQTWDLLLLAPLEPRELIGDKFHGILDCARPYLIGYAVPALAMAAGLGVRACVWTILYLVVAWATVYFMGAIGLYWSTYCQSSWRSLLATLAYGYSYGLVILVTGLLTFGLAGIILSMALLGAVPSRLDWLVFEYIVPVAVCLGISWFLGHSARFYLGRAERWVAVRERIWSEDNRLRFDEENEFRRLCLERDRQESRAGLR